MTMKTLSKLALVALLAWPCLHAVAQEAVIRANLGSRLPELKDINEINKTDIPGIYEVRANKTEIYYTDAKGNYLIQGSLIDLRNRRNLTDERVEKLTAISFSSLPVKDAFTIIRGNGQRKLAVFEDPNCGYCKRFERDLQKVDNITIYMFLFPILSADSGEKSKAIWCAKDRAQTWQDWMVHEVALPTNSPACDVGALARNLELGRNAHISGTPTLIFKDGTKVPGAIDAAEVEKRLTAAKG